MTLNEQILNALKNVEDPDLKQDIVTLGMVKDLKTEGNKVNFTVELTTPACPMKDMIHNACINAVKHLVDKNLEVEVNMSSRVKSGRDESTFLPDVKNIVAVASGKGGVGKSTVSVNLARALSATGAKVGLLDADLYGPSIPTLMGMKEAKPASRDKKIIPVEKEGFKVLSIGFMVKEDQPIVWRGPMLSQAIKQLLNDADWGNLDYLIIDLPPGTGDIHITMAQQVPLTGVVFVTTPQTVAVDDCRRAISMFKMQGVTAPILGIVENMAWFEVPEMPDKRYFIFGKGGAEKLSSEFEIPVLCRIPLSEKIRELSDSGGDIFSLTEKEKAAYEMLGGEVARQLSVLAEKVPLKS